MFHFVLLDENRQNHLKSAIDNQINHNSNFDSSRDLYIETDGVV